MRTKGWRPRTLHLLCYTSSMTKKTLEQKIDALTSVVEKKFNTLEARMDKGFAAVADDIAEVREKVATKDQVFGLQTQVNAIETDIRDMKHPKLHARVADLEEKV